MSNRKTSEPSLRALSFILRHKELWPEGFEWNFRTCNTCAMGLAHQIWPKHVKQPNTPDMQTIFGMTPDQSMIFSSQAYLYNANVTPEMVADKIDQLETVCF